jgi:hypothetical protein
MYLLKMETAHEKPKHLPNGNVRFVFKCGCVWVFTQSLWPLKRTSHCRPHWSYRFLDWKREQIEYSPNPLSRNRLQKIRKKYIRS